MLVCGTALSAGGGTAPGGGGTCACSVETATSQNPKQYFKAVFIYFFGGTLVLAVIAALFVLDAAKPGFAVVFVEPGERAAAGAVVAVPGLAEVPAGAALTGAGF
jgi:hypothetical protein